MNSPWSNRPQVVIVTPALADANNGNWQTARRWREFLAGAWPTRLAAGWPDEAAAGDRIMLALHARRSAAAIRAWAEARRGGLAVVLTGTDLYRDIHGDADAQRSLALADALVVLQELGPRTLPAAVRDKARVIFQSTTERRTLTKTDRHLRAAMVGHLRDEKAPQTLFAAARLLSPAEGIRIDHVGAPLDPALGAQAVATGAACPHYRWLGALPHPLARARIQRAHLLVHASRMEGGAHVVMEAIASGTPVVASRIDGNVGMLGEDYAGYFPPGDAAALARLLRECRAGQANPDGLLARLARQCETRRPLFHPAAERGALRRLVEALAGR
jgi:putative glycosyltransferase (TIGR04348 family)